MPPLYPDLSQISDPEDIEALKSWAGALKREFDNIYALLDNKTIIDAKIKVFADDLPSSPVTLSDYKKAAANLKEMIEIIRGFEDSQEIDKHIEMARKIWLKGGQLIALAKEENDVPLIGIEEDDLRHIRDKYQHLIVPYGNVPDPKASKAVLDFDMPIDALRNFFRQNSVVLEASRFFAEQYEMKKLL